MRIPVLLVTPNDEGFMRGTANLRISLESFLGDMEIVPEFTLGFEVNEQEPKLITLDQFTLYSAYRDDSRFCLGLRWERSQEAFQKGRKPAGAFPLKLPAEAEWLFDEQGYLRSEEKLAAVARSLARRVDLDPGGLTDEQDSIYTYLYPGNFKDIKNFFYLVPGDQPRQALLDGDIPAEMSLESGRPLQQRIMIRIKNIQIYHPDSIQSPHSLTYIVRPRE